MDRLKGKVAIVTGATSGIGRGIAETFAGEGAAVIVGGRDRVRGRVVVDSIRAKGGTAEFVAVDVTTFAGNQTLVAAAIDCYGAIDIAIPNAGILGTGSVTTVPLETWRQTLATNLDAVFFLARAVIPEMQKRGGGTFVVMGSIFGCKGDPKHPAYCASKGALLPLVKEIAMDYGPDIRINLLASGPVDTHRFRKTLASGPDPEGVRVAVAEGMPMKRLGTPEDIAKAALFLASEESSWMTGTALTVDGGSLCGA